MAGKSRGDRRHCLLQHLDLLKCGTFRLLLVPSHGRGYLGYRKPAGTSGDGQVLSGPDGTLTAPGCLVMLDTCDRRIPEKMRRERGIESAKFVEAALEDD
jgi:hypothetical protein